MNKWIKVGAILIVLVLLFIPAIIAMKYVAISQIYSHFVDSVSNLTGLNKYLVKAGVALMLIPLYIGLKFFFSINKTRRYIGASILITLLAVYNLSLYNFTKDLSFAFSEGKALKWYALTPEGVKFFDRSGVEPIYGIILKPVTPEVIRNLKLLQKGEFRPVDPNKVQFFNPITGEPQIWYYQYPDGSLEFYDKPGYHPITGEPLKPATKQVYFDWKEKAKMQPLPPIAIAPRLQEFKSIINDKINIHSGKPNIAMIIESKRTESGVSPEDSFYNLLRTEKVNIILNLFKEESFKSKGFFREIYDGNTKLLRQADALSRINYLILGRLDYSFQKRAEVDKDLVSCNINFSYKIINKNAEVVKSESIRVVGPGFTNDSALERGLEILSEQYSDRILKQVL